VSALTTVSLASGTHGTRACVFLYLPYLEVYVIDLFYFLQKQWKDIRYKYVEQD
jgi:hypothetical protein